MRISDWSVDLCSSDLLRPERRNANRNLDQFVEIISGKIVIHAVKMLADSMFDHVGIGRDHERRVLQEQEQPYRFEGGNGGWWKAPVEIVDEHDPRRSEERRGGKECVSRGRCWWSRSH